MSGDRKYRGKGPKKVFTKAVAGLTACTKAGGSNLSLDIRAAEKSSEDKHKVEFISRGTSSHFIAQKHQQREKERNVYVEDRVDSEQLGASPERKGKHKDKIRRNKNREFDALPASQPDVRQNNVRCGYENVPRHLHRFDEFARNKKDVLPENTCSENLGRNQRITKIERNHQKSSHAPNDSEKIRDICREAFAEYLSTLGQRRSDFKLPTNSSNCVTSKADETQQKPSVEEKSKHLLNKLQHDFKQVKTQAEAPKGLMRRDSRDNLEKMLSNIQSQLCDLSKQLSDADRESHNFDAPSHNKQEGESDNTQMKSRHLRSLPNISSPPTNPDERISCYAKSKIQADRGKMNDPSLSTEQVRRDSVYKQFSELNESYSSTREKPNREFLDHLDNKTSQSRQLVQGVSYIPSPDSSPLKKRQNAYVDDRTQDVTETWSNSPSVMNQEQFSDEDQCPIKIFPSNSKRVPRLSMDRLAQFSKEDIRNELRRNAKKSSISNSHEKYQLDNKIIQNETLEQAQHERINLPKTACLANEGFISRNSSHQSVNEREANVALVSKLSRELLAKFSKEDIQENYKQTLKSRSLQDNCEPGKSTSGNYGVLTESNSFDSQSDTDTPRSRKLTVDRIKMFTKVDENHDGSWESKLAFHKSMERKRRDDDLKHPHEVNVDETYSTTNTASQNISPPDDNLVRSRLQMFVERERGIESRDDPLVKVTKQSREGSVTEHRREDRTFSSENTCDTYSSSRINVFSENKPSAQPANLNQKLPLVYFDTTMRQNMQSENSWDCADKYSASAKHSLSFENDFDEAVHRKILKKIYKNHLEQRKKGDVSIGTDDAFHGVLTEVPNFSGNLPNKVPILENQLIQSPFYQLRLHPENCPTIDEVEDDDDESSQSMSDIAKTKQWLSQRQSMPFAKVEESLIQELCGMLRSVSPTGEVCVTSETYNAHSDTSSNVLFKKLHASQPQSRRGGRSEETVKETYSQNTIHLPKHSDSQKSVQNVLKFAPPALSTHTSMESIMSLKSQSQRQPSDHQQCRQQESHPMASKDDSSSICAISNSSCLTKLSPKTPAGQARQSNVQEQPGTGVDASPTLPLSERVKRLRKTPVTERTNSPPIRNSRDRLMKEIQNVHTFFYRKDVTKKSPPQGSEKQQPVFKQEWVGKKKLWMMVDCEERRVTENVNKDSTSFEPEQCTAKEGQPVSPVKKIGRMISNDAFKNPSSSNAQLQGKNGPGAAIFSPIEKETPSPETSLLATPTPLHSRMALETTAKGQPQNTNHVQKEDQKPISRCHSPCKQTINRSCADNFHQAGVAQANSISVDIDELTFTYELVIPILDRLTEEIFANIISRSVRTKNELNNVVHMLERVGEQVLDGIKMDVIRRAKHDNVEDVTTFLSKEAALLIQNALIQNCLETNHWIGAFILDYMDGYGFLALEEPLAGRVEGPSKNSNVSSSLTVPRGNKPSTCHSEHVTAPFPRLRNVERISSWPTRLVENQKQGNDSKVQPGSINMCSNGTYVDDQCMADDAGVVCGRKVGPYRNKKHEQRANRTSIPGEPLSNIYAR